EIRDELPAEGLSPEAIAQLNDYRVTRGEGGNGRLDLGRKDPRFWPAVGVVLDVVQATEARVSDAAQLLGITTGNLIEFLQCDPKGWQSANAMRTRFGQKPLR